MKILFLYLGILVFGNVLSAQDRNSPVFGVNAMFGGRFDNMRMCVATDAGTKGGPFGDVQLNIKWNGNPGRTMILNIPVMRPILFGTAFKMLQFEPGVTYILNRDDRIVYGAGFGISLHYGPDYKADLDNRGDEFFAAGPLISGFAGLRFDSDKKERMLALRILYVALFAKQRSPGTVAGAALEYSRYF